VNRRLLQQDEGESKFNNLIRESHYTWYCTILPWIKNWFKNSKRWVLIWFYNWFFWFSTQSIWCFIMKYHLFEVKYCFFNPLSHVSGRYSFFVLSYGIVGKSALYTWRTFWRFFILTINSLNRIRSFSLNSGNFQVFISMGYESTLCSLNVRCTFLYFSYSISLI